MPNFQLTLIFWNILIAFLIFIVVLFQIASGMHDLSMMGTNAGFPPNHPYFMFVREMSGNFYIHITIAFFVGMAVSWLMTLYVSHKVAGPLYRMKSYFEKISGGDEVKDISFRKGDYLTEFAGVINGALKKITKS